MIFCPDTGDMHITCMDEDENLAIAQFQYQLGSAGRSYST